MTTEDALMEIDFGRCGGLTELEIEARFPGLRDERMRDKWRHRWPDGESYADAEVRVRARLEAFLRDQRAPLLVIAHQSMNRVLSRALSGAEEDAVLAMAQPSDVVLRFEGGAASHARLVSGGEPVQWSSGLYTGATPKLN
jgi:probable phosphoglycerate mutase